MSFLDSFYSVFNPKKAYEREVYRKFLDEASRNYDAGGYGRINARWRSINESGEFTDRWQRDTIRARARDLERNSDMAQGVISAFKRNVVGRGFTLQAKTGDPDLSREIDELWKVWCRRRNCDVTATQNFNQICRMAVGRKKVDGGMIILKRYTTGGILPFKMQCLEVDELAKEQMTPQKKGNRVVGGIEYNEYNRAVGYWVQQYSLDGMTVDAPVYFPAKDVIFYFSKSRPSQVREMSDMAHSITRIRDANEFINAVSIKERIAACLAVFIKRTPPLSGGLGRSNAMISPDGKVDYAGKTLSPGMITEMAAGDEIQVVNPQGSGADAGGFLKTQQRLVGTGQGLSYEATSRDMSDSNYSSARQSAAEDGLTYDEERELLIECVMDEVYETFLISAVLSGLVEIKDFWTDKEKYMAHVWVASPKPWIDPVKESTANKTALQSGQKTFQQICAESGRGWKDVIDDMAEAQKYAKEKEIDLGGIIYGKGTSSQQAAKPTTAKTG